MPHTTPALPALSAEQTAARYALLCRATCPPDATSPVQRELHALQRVIDQQLPDLARHYCPPGFADIWLGQRLLPAQIDPTTSLPTCLLHGERHAIHALNRFCRLIELSPEEFASLTHDEQANWGSSTARLLEAAYVSHPAFAWPHLAFIDTPGYSKPDEAAAAQRTDAELARAWLNGAHAIVWAVSAEAGCISEEDLNFLATLNPAIPRVIAVTRADKKPEEDVAAIVALIGKTMHERQLPAEAVWAVSSRRPTHFQMPQLLDWLQQQAANPPQPARFADAVYGLYGRYAQQLKDEQAHMQQRLNDCKQSIPLIENLQAANALTEEAQSLEKKLEENSRADAHLEQLTEAISKHLIAAGQALGLDVKHMTLKAPEERMLLKPEDVPSGIMKKIIYLVASNNEVMSDKKTKALGKYEFVYCMYCMPSILNCIPEDKYKFARHLRDLRSVLTIRKKGGDVRINLTLDDDSPKPEKVIYAGKEYLAPIKNCCGLPARS